MLGENKVRWAELAEAAARETDPEKFMAIIRELNQLLEEKQKRLASQPPPAQE